MSTILRPPPGTTFDPLYPDCDGKPMGETEYHILAITHLYEVLRPWFRSHDDVHVAANMLLYYEQGNPSAVRGPDVMVTKGVRGKHFRRSFRTWEEGVAPTMIIEVTSFGTKNEDQFVKPAVYAHIGVKEYFLFDPLGEYLRPRLQGFRLVSGAYVPMIFDAVERLTSGELDLDLVADAHLLRVVDRRTGRRLPTGEEYQAQLKVEFRLPVNLKQLVEEAAVLRGQSLGDFALSTVVENAQRVIQQHRVTTLTERDRDIFLGLLDDESLQPSDALIESAELYKQWMHRNGQ